MPTSARLEVANSLQITVKTVQSAGSMCTGKRQTHIRNAPSSRTAVTGIGLYGQAGKCIRIRRRFSIIRCILPGGAEPRPYQLHLFCRFFA